MNNNISNLSLVNKPKNKLLTLVLMQLKNKLDLNVKNNKKQLLRTALLSVLKFVLITGIVYLLLYLSSYFGLFYDSDFSRVMVIVLTLSLLLSLISCTIELMKNLYFSEDNKVLITFPVDSNKIFISKLIVFYLYEIKKSFSFLLPITLSCVLFLSLIGKCPIYMLFWMFIPIIFILMIPVLIGALLSIIAMYVTRFLKKVPILQALVCVTIFAFVIYGVVYLIKLIPTNIDLINQWPTVSKAIRNFLLFIEEKLPFMAQLVSILIGDITVSLVYSLNIMSFVKLLILIAICASLFIIAYFISRPIFFGMMAKSFEINKRIGKDKINVRRNKLITFVDKEFKINIRNMSISLNYIIVYIVLPILILFLNVMYQAMNSSSFGELLTYTFNILMITLPLLASNALVATYYSREGRAAYIKKTKPLNVAYPLLTKLFFNIILSIPCVFSCVFIFGNRANFTITITLILGFAILFLHLGHMIFSASLDIMNPQNEQYATSGEIMDNPNENKSTLFAFIISAVFAIIAYKFFSEAVVTNKVGDLIICVVKLMSITFVYFISMLYLFFKKIKAFYYEIQG
jgi:hypothetical protein